MTGHINKFWHATTGGGHGALEKLAVKGAEWSEAKLHAAIERLVGWLSPYLKVRVSQKGKGPRVTWSY
ncbi:MAG: hypothetical protein ACRECR_01110 [Thermoplasmata archaeon]